MGNDSPFERGRNAPVGAAPPCVAPEFMVPRRKEVPHGRRKTYSCREQVHR